MQHERLLAAAVAACQFAAWKLNAALLLLLLRGTGWNHSTQLTRQEHRQWQQQLDSKAAAATVKRTGELKT
jgi:hypothetical protein